MIHSEYESVSLFHTLEMFSVDSDNESCISTTKDKNTIINVCRNNYATETFVGFDDYISNADKQEIAVVDLTICEEENTLVNYKPGEITDKKLSNLTSNANNSDSLDTDNILESKIKCTKFVFCNKLKSEYNSCSNINQKSSNSAANINPLKLCCKYCCKSFLNYKKMNRHICKIDYECCMCKKKLHKLYYTKNANNTFICLLCELEFASLRDFRKHFNVHSIETDNVCCHRCKNLNHSNISSFDKRSNIKDEIVSNFDSNITLEYSGFQNAVDKYIGSKIQCNFCSQCFKSKMKHKRHLLECSRRMMHHPNMMVDAKKDNVQDELLDSYCESGMKIGQCMVSPLVCHSCGKLFIEKIELDEHLKMKCKVAVDKTFCCDVCGKLFGAKWTLQVHVRSHYVNNSFKCPTCDKAFTRKDTLNRHIMLHANNKPHVCTICSKQFTERSKLVLHIRVHTKERPFSCEYCGKNFSAHNDLKRHINRKHSYSLVSSSIHSNDPAGFFCDFCEKGFSLKCSLRAHIKVHNKEKAFRCDVCGKTFNRNWNMKSHAKTHDKHIV